MENEKRKIDRRDLSLYMRVLDELSGKPLGILSDISTGGFRLESRGMIPVNVNIRLRIENTAEISSKKFIVFTAQARWCERDQIDPSFYNAGFKIIDMTPSDLEIFVQMFNSYGARGKVAVNKSADYFWN